MAFGNALPSSHRVQGAACLLLLQIGAILTTSCVQLRHGPVGFWSRNRYDKSGDNRHGPWREYFDKEEKQVANRGRYRHGFPVGKWQNYTPSGQLDHTEKFYPDSDGLVVLSYYYPSGQLEKQGRARYRLETTGAHFYWFGEWKRYAPAGQFLGSEWYQEGIKVATPVESGAAR